MSEEPKHKPGEVRRIYLPDCSADVRELMAMKL